MAALLGRAIEHVESRGDTWAVSPAGARGLWQVQPQWARVPWWALHVPAIGRAEGRRILARWLKRCRLVLRLAPVGSAAHESRMNRCALRAYACGRRGLRAGWCGWYADRVLSEVR